MNKKLTAIGLSAGLLAGVGAGYVLQNSGNASASISPAAAVTTVPNGATTPLITGASNNLATVLAPLVADGTITQAQADKVIAALQSAGVGVGMPGGMGDGGMGDDGHGMGGDGQRGPGMGGDILTTVADTIGISAADLQTGISGGKTIADIAAANGSSGQKVIDALVAQMKAHFDPEVKSGEHTQAEVDQRLADFTTRITQFVNDTQNAPMGGPGMRGRGDGDGDHMGGDMGGGMNGGMGGGAIDAGPSDTTAGADA